MYKVSPTTRKTTLKIKLPDARSVAVAGDFNKWSTQADLMKKGKDGVWKIDLALKAGEHQFRYFVDDNYWVNDDEAPQVANAFGTDNSVASIKLKSSRRKK
jgi:1,4-alpha-glucan branching enzyme